MFHLISFVSLNVHPSAPGFQAVTNKQLEYLWEQFYISLYLPRPRSQVRRRSHSRISPPQTLGEVYHIQDLIKRHKSCERSRSFSAEQPDERPSPASLIHLQRFDFSCSRAVSEMMGKGKPPICLSIYL
ncbi:hypothetical protein ILYODFUR_029657 [Ilyodon furcidens]|uniref:Uncharacterized protein n=1 Tax=Ilyodon furcidens TaxID=33524 RepID=A0ABV0STT3_9TELE